jgi:hypothetical protein
MIIFIDVKSFEILTDLLIEISTYKSIYEKDFELDKIITSFNNDNLPDEILINKGNKKLLEFIIEKNEKYKCNIAITY